MQHACHKPHNLGLMSVRMFKREKDDGIQTLLGVMVGWWGELGGGGGGGLTERIRCSTWRQWQAILLHKAMLVQLWYVPSASGPQIFLEPIFVCFFGLLVSLKLMTVARYRGRMEWINLVGDLLRGRWSKSGDFTSWSVLHNAQILFFYSHLCLLDLFRFVRLHEGENSSWPADWP